jgi:hypothetical protein
MLLVVNRDGKRPLGKPKRRRVDNIKMNVKDIRRSGMDWIEQIQNKDYWETLVSTVMNIGLH